MNNLPRRSGNSRMLSDCFLKARHYHNSKVFFCFYNNYVEKGFIYILPKIFNMLPPNQTIFPVGEILPDPCPFISTREQQALTRLSVHRGVAVQHAIGHICALQGQNCWRLELKLLLNLLEATLHLGGAHVVKMPLCFLNDTVCREREAQGEHRQDGHSKTACRERSARC